MTEKMQNESLFDAIFAAAARQAALEKIDDSAVSPEEYHAFSPAYEKRKRAILRQHKGRLRRKNILQVARRAAVIALVIIGVTFGGLMSVEAVRNEVIRVVTEWFDKFTTVGFDSEGDSQPDQDIDLRESGMMLPSYIPDGYELVELDRTRITVFAVYQNSNENTAIFEQMATGNDDSISIDNEHYTISTVTVHGFEGILALDDSENLYASLIWHDGVFTFTLTGAFGEEEIRSIAESLQLQD